MEHMTVPPSNVPEVPGVRLTGVLGRGGFAVVYAGEQLSLQRPVAVKVDTRPLHDERNRRRFQREMQAASQISSHPHVVTLIDTGVLPDDRPYLVMERCDGGSLANVVARGPQPPAEAARIIHSASAALGAAHAAGVLHRDIKPGNILLDSYGAPRLSDFGLAAIQRAEASTTVTLEALTPAYAPPEAFSHTEPTSAGDVWSMGAVLFALLTGRGPRSTWDGRSQSLSEIVADLHRPVPTNDPRIPPPLRPILDRAMHVDPGQRFRNGAELAQALNSVLPRLEDGSLRDMDATTYRAPLGSDVATVYVPPPPPTITYSPITVAPRRRPIALIAGIAAVVLLAGGAAWGAVAALSGPSLTLPPKSAPPPTPSTSDEPTQTRTDPPNFEGELDRNDVPTSDDMPWEFGACLDGAIDSQGNTSATTVDCAVANWRVFAGGSIDPDIEARNAQEAMKKDPKVAETCTDENAERAGIDISKPHKVRVLGPKQNKWDEGQRGFSCVFALN
ncbi:serine/threonine protein kinase [Arachnia propionica]|uniref:non-specific serine/threonine protein kinase n=2 Tax=Arachnia propionica TaxID=1750 RepID=A0A3P1WQ65_9ACTN|nr:serine/threonine protein kinase [Arachnia propionica]